jgi:hypothetical protein
MIEGNKNHYKQICVYWWCVGLAIIMHPIVLGVAFFHMTPFLPPSLVQNAPCPHCSSLYISNDLSRHVKSLHLHASLVSHVSQVAFKCPPFLCYTLILSLLLLGVSFELNLSSFHDCLKFIFPTLNYFIGSFEPSRMKLGELSTYPLTELLEIRWTNQHSSISSCYHLRRSFRSTRAFCSP